MATVYLGDPWRWLLAARSHDAPRPPAELAANEVVARMLPLLGAPHAHRPFVYAHVAQSLDGRIALPCGASQWITGEEDLDHTHAMRALADAVLVGASTVDRDDPQLTVRRVEGHSPLRVVVDPHGRVAASRRVYADGGPTLRIVRPGHPDIPGVASVAVAGDGPLDLTRVLGELHDRGVRRLFVEGGGVTLGHMLAAGVVDRLHVVVAPMLLGQGTPSVVGSLGRTLAGCPHPAVRVMPLGRDWLFDCALGAP